MILKIGVFLLLAAVIVVAGRELYKIFGEYLRECMELSKDD
ncbi:MAG: hypothetical protein AAB897_03040 [Patescibacteria group bacterium]